MAESLGVRTDLMVLAIDDDPTACAIIEGLIIGSSIPASVETTTDPSKGLILCGALKPDLLLIDVMMPGIDGFEVAARLAEVGEGKVPTIVFITASPEPEVSRRVVEAGHTILLKPIRRREIDELLSSLAARPNSTST